MMTSGFVNFNFATCSRSVKFNYLLPKATTFLGENLYVADHFYYNVKTKEM